MTHPLLAIFVAGVVTLVAMYIRGENVVAQQEKDYAQQPDSGE